MAKVFTIIPGLENMGAMNTGGQGSVYKGRRVEEVITAIKLLPTPIYNESEDDKNYRDFKNEVEKLKKVNEQPNPNIVKILSSGLSETGNFPYIEMEYIDGPDLEELLRPPHDPVFTIKEVIKVAEQLSNALAHCHRLDVRHGDIKSNNVKFNKNTGNYVLLDFGLAIMSDEQRRTSLRHAGAVEFMAPEQNEGQMLFQTDVYSFGVILFELLAGTVPFPLASKGETARNTVRLAHMETLPPDVVALRREKLPATWPPEKKASEMDVPQWLVNVIYKCLKKKPENRFGNGIELNNYIMQNSSYSLGKEELPGFKGDGNESLLMENRGLQQQVAQYSSQLSEKEKELNDFKLLVGDKEREIQLLKDRQVIGSAPSKKGVSATAFTVLLLLTICLAAFSAYSFLKNKPQDLSSISGNEGNMADTPAATVSQPENKMPEKKEPPAPKKEVSTLSSGKTIDSSAKTMEQPAAGDKEAQASNTENENKQAAPDTPVKNQHQYMVVSKAYFYTEPDENTRRNAFVVPSNNAILNALDEKDDFIYVVFTNQLGQSSKGWLRKKDLQPLNE